MKNSDLTAQLDALTEAAEGLRQDLARSEDMPVLAMAPALVQSMKLNRDLAKLASAARKQLAPLLGPDGQGDKDADKPKRPRK